MLGGTEGRVSRMRKQQIDTLQLYNNRVVRVVEGCEYRVGLNVDSRPFTIVVTLSPEFPLEKPVLRLQPPLAHPWVNPATGEIVSAPGLLKFTFHSELGRVVQAIVREFESGSPSLLDSSKDNSLESPPDMSSNGDSSLLSNLNSLPLPRLELINSRADELDEFISSLPPVVDLSKAIEEEMSRIESMALDNISRENEMATLRQDVDSLSSKLSRSLNEYNSLTAEYSKLSEKFDPRAIRESLAGSISRIDEESERTAERFLEGQIDLDRFLNEYSSRRFLSHSRKMRAENLAMQLNKLHEAGF